MHFVRFDILVHVPRGDHFVILLPGGLEVMFFFHPSHNDVESEILYHVQLMEIWLLAFPFLVGLGSTLWSPQNRFPGSYSHIWSDERSIRLAKGCQPWKNSTFRSVTLIHRKRVLPLGPLESQQSVWERT